jgi:hypothetical protein
VLSGTPTTAGTYNFAVQATNTGGSATYPAGTGNNTIVIAPAAAGGATVSVEGTPIPVPSKFAGIRPATHAGLNGAGALFAWAVDPARCNNTQPAIIHSWHHNIDFTNHRLQGQQDFFDMAVNESLTYEFTPTTADITAGFISLGTNTQYTLPANFINFSTKPCDFDLTKLVPGAGRDYCYSTAVVDNAIYYSVVAPGTAAVPFTCNLVAGTKYYFNLRWENGSPGAANTVDGCAAGGYSRCGGWIQIR